MKLSAGGLQGNWGVVLAREAGEGSARWLNAEVRIDAYGGYSTWFTLEVMRDGKMEAKREFPGLAQAVRAYNEVSL